MMLISRYIINLIALFEVSPRLMKMKVNAILNALHMAVKHPRKVTKASVRSRFTADGNAIYFIAVLLQNGLMSIRSSIGS